MPKKEKKDSTQAGKKAAGRTKVAAKPARRAPSRRPTAARRRVSAPAPAPDVARRPAAGAPTNGDIALKAYYLAERRHHLGLPGDPEGDWLEAERLLRD
jgi:hypothetical protein